MSNENSKNIKHVPFQDLRREYLEIASEVDEALRQVFSRSRYVLGDELRQFEEEFAAYLRVRHVVGVGSGTEALHLALVALGIGPGDEVITVPNTALPTVCAISAAGARPVLVDVDPTTLNMDPSLLEGVITERTRAILPVHLYGRPAAMDGVLEVGARHAVPVVEDACQAHGAQWEGAKVGGLGPAGCFSFYPTKNLGCYGDGGAVATNDDRLAERLRLLRNYGQTDRYHHRIKGFNSRLDEIQAAVLRVKLRYLDRWNERRRSLAGRYREALEGAVGFPEDRPEAECVHHLQVVRHPERDAFRRSLEAAGVQTLVHYPIPVHLQEAYADLGWGKGSFPQAERAAEEIVSLPLYPGLTDEELDLVTEAALEFSASAVGARR